MATRSLAFPPCGDGMGCESRRVVRDADADSAAVVRRVVNAVGDADSAGVDAEVMIVHSNRRAIPFGSGVFEVADQFSFLTVDADDGKTLTLEACPQRGNMLELLIPVRTGVGGDLLPVHTQREIHLVEQARNGIGRNRNIDLLKKFSELLCRLTGPLQPRDGISGGIVLQDNLDGSDYFGRFFPPAYVHRPLCAPDPPPRPALTTAVFRAPRCEGRGRGSRPGCDRHHAPT